MASSNASTKQDSEELAGVQEDKKTPIPSVKPRAQVQEKIIEYLGDPSKEKINWPVVADPNKLYSVRAGGNPFKHNPELLDAFKNQKGQKRKQNGEQQTEAKRQDSKKEDNSQGELTELQKREMRDARLKKFGH